MDLPLLSNLDPEKAPFMQIVRLRIDGVDYDFFGPELAGEGEEIGQLFEVAFLGTVPLPTVLLMLAAAWSHSTEEEKNKLQ